MIGRPRTVDMDSRTNTLPARRNAMARRQTPVSAPRMRFPEPPQWLEGWRPSEALPASLDEIQASLTLFEAETEPSDPEAIQAALALAVELFGAPAEFERKVHVYYGLLADIPDDLLLYGVWAALRDECTYFPKPAEIRAPIRDELSRRHLIRRRLGTALTLARRTEDRRRAS